MRPSKTLRETALALSGFRARELHGVDLSLGREATIADFMHHEKAVAASEQASELIHVGLAALLMDAGWDLFNRISFN